MIFNGSEGSPIDRNTAAAWTKNYREAAPDGLHGHFFGRELLTKLLNQEGCTGIRFYYGLRDDVPQLLAVGADQEGNDQLDPTHHVVDDSKPCPPYCSRPNILNG